MTTQTEQEPMSWKLVPVKPTDEMLKAMDECSTEGYDERLYAGHAASVYMAAVDVAPTPPQRKPFNHHEFGYWWFEYGSGLHPLEGEDQEQHAYRVATAAWQAAHGIKE